MNNSCKKEFLWEHWTKFKGNQTILYFKLLRNTLNVYEKIIICSHVLRSIPYLAYLACTWPICFLFKFNLFSKIVSYSTRQRFYSYTNAGTRTHKFAIQNTNHHSAQTNVLYIHNIFLQARNSVEVSRVLSLDPSSMRFMFMKYANYLLFSVYNNMGSGTEYTTNTYT